MTPGEIAATLRKARDDRGLTLRETAGQLGFVPSAVNGWENSRRRPSLDNLAIWADFFGYEITLTPKKEAGKC